MVIIHGFSLLFQSQLYLGVIKDVVAGVREAFLDEGCDESVLAELKQVKSRIITYQVLGSQEYIIFLTLAR